MAGPQQTVDFSAGLVPKAEVAPVDFSAGLVPKEQAQRQGTPPEATPPGFFKRLGQSFGVPTSQEEADAAMQPIREAFHAAISPTGPPLPLIVGKLASRPALAYAKNVYQSGKEGWQETADAARNILQGQPILPNIGKAAYGQLHAGLSVVPGIGPTTDTAGQDIAQGNYRGAAGGLTGAITQAALMSEPGQKVISKTTSLVKNAPAAIADTARSVYGVANPEALTAEQSATKALKPRNSKVSWTQDVGSALPDVRRAMDASGTDVNSATFDDVDQATQQAKKDVWGEYENNFKGPNKSASVDTSPVARTIRSTVSQRTLEQNPALADHVEAIARTYDGRQLSVGELEDRVAELNRETRGIEARYPADKAAAKDLPENAPAFAERNALKNLLIGKLDELSGPGAQQLRNRYGSLNSFQDVLQRRKTVYERQNPESLGEQVGRFQGVGQIVKGGAKLFTSPLSGVADIAGGVATRAAAKAGRQLNDSQVLLRQALRKTQPRPAMIQRVRGEYVQPAPPPQLPGIAGFLPHGQYEAPSSAVRPQAALPMPVMDGEYLPPVSPRRPGIRGFLPRGTYEQPGGFEPNQPALPAYRGIQLPDKGRKSPVSRYTRLQGETR